LIIANQPTYDAWKRKYGSMAEPDVKRLQELEKENTRLRRLLAERDVKIDVMKEFIEKSLRRERAAWPCGIGADCHRCHAGLILVCA
jgi:hypothetical protein